MNIKKLFAVLAGVSMLATQLIPAGALAATYSQELQDAYNWAYSKSITTMSSIDNANMYGAITRAELAKMLANWAKDKGQTPDTSKACSFTDTASVQGDLATAIVEACQLGLMGQGITAFRPYDTISRAEFGTALSRALWGSQYEGGNPYYVNHLNALKAAGIMTQIANAESTKEVRGYVMLMLMRSEGAEGSSSTSDCDDPLVVIACAAESDACPAACREDAKEDEDQAPKSGSLQLSATSFDAKVFIGRASDLDMLTFRTSEEVEISKVILERYGYSTPKNVYRVWLEDENGAVISNQTDLDNKGQAKLTIKKDYRKVDGEFNATIVLEAEDGTHAAQGYTATNPGATFGFKVVDVTSTAKDVDLDNYKPATYEAIAYDGSTVTLTSRGSATVKQYNFEAGKMYEVAKFKIQTPDDSAIKVKGFTLENDDSNVTPTPLTKLDLHKYFEDAEVTIGGEAVKGLNAEANKNGELVISFKDFEIAAKSKADVVVKISLADDFDAFNAGVLLQLTEFNAVDSKVSSRVRLVPIAYTDVITTNPAIEYQFRGGKVKLTNVKLGNVDASQNAEDIVVAEGSIEVPEALKGSFTLNASGKGAGAIKQLTVVVNGDDTDANPVFVSYDDGTATPNTTKPGTFTTAGYTANQYVTYNGGVFTNAAAVAAGVWNDADWTPVDATYSFTFNNVEIEKSGKVKFLVDIKDYASWNGQTITFDSFKFANAGDKLDYDESGKTAKGDVSGSISFSKVTIQASKASLKNNLTKDVEFPNKLTRTEVVFDGTYTAKKGDIKLNEFLISQTVAAYPATNKITFYLYVDGDLVADADAVRNAGNTAYEAADTFDDVLVKAGESVSVKVEAEVEADNAAPFTSQALGKYTLKIRGDDENGNPNSGNGSASTISMKVVDKGSATVSTPATKQTVIRKASNAKIAEFTIKPANGASSVDLESIAFDIYGVVPTLADDKITVEVDGIDEDDFNVTGSYTLTYTMNREIKSEGAVVTITLDDETSGTISITNLYVNEKKQTKTFNKMFVDAAVWVKSQSASNGATTFVLGVDKDPDVSVRNFTVYYNSTFKALEKEFDDGDKLSVNGTDGTPYDVVGVSYEYTSGRTWNTNTSKCFDVDGVADVTSTYGTEAACIWSTIKIKKATTPDTPAGGTVLPDYFKVGENEDDLRVVYKM